MKTIESKILVKTEKKVPTEKIGGLVIPVSADEYDEHVVVSVGEKVTSIKPGDRILTYKGSGTSFKYDGQDLRVIGLADILIVL